MLLFVFLPSDTFNSMHTLYAEELRLNTNILETNVINIVFLLGLLFYGNKTLFVPLLEKRRNQIVRQIEEAEDNIRKATSYYFFTEKALLKNVYRFPLLQRLYKENTIFIIKKKCIEKKNALLQTFLVGEQLLGNYEKKAFASLQKYAIIFTASTLAKECGNLSENRQVTLIKKILSSLGGK